MPRRHVTALRHRRDQLASLADIVVSQQRKWRGFARPVTCGANVENNRSNVLGEGHALLRLGLDLSYRDNQGNNQCETLHRLKSNSGSIKYAIENNVVA